MPLFSPEDASVEDSPHAVAVNARDAVAMPAVRILVTRRTRVSFH